VNASAHLLSGGIWIQDHFLAPAQILSLLECAQLREARGDFAAARVGGPTTAQRRQEIRGDFTCWIGEPLFPAERSLLNELEALRLQLNRQAFLGLLELELHYARYPPGAFYDRHVDQPQGSTLRKVSLVLYLNAEWDRQAGGALRIFHADAGFQDIEPIGGRLVCFLTPGREHAVLPTLRNRFSISGWFRAREA
jgi:SM-20-related protein